jgi:UDPglucose 6-dehydrogenase
LRIGHVGLGKLGLPVALAIERRGHTVCGTDANPDVKTYLESRFIPFREEGLQPLLDNHDIQWHDTVDEVVADSDIIFVAIQTPHAPEFEGATIMPDAREDFDYTFLKEGVAAVAAACERLGVRKTVAVISTCLPGTFSREIAPLLNDFVDYVYTPQFIAMGTVLQDYLHPEFNLIGVCSDEAADLLEEFYATINDAPCIRTGVTTAEGIKVSYNTWITAKTVIANCWGEMCERMGMNFDDMKAAWDLADRRLLSSRYMDAGMSDGGGCHPRDNIALSWLAEEVDMSFNIWDALMHARQEYEAWHAEVASYYAEKHDLPLIVLGTAFKPETDIETGSAAMLMADILRQSGEQFLHVNDVDYMYKAVYFLATNNERYRSLEFPEGSVVVDPFGVIPDRDGVTVKRLGRR